MDLLYLLKAGPAGGRQRHDSHRGTGLTLHADESQSRPSLSSMLARRLWPCPCWLCLGVRGGDDLGGHVGELA
jgi:hypothetical protein